MNAMPPITIEPVTTAGAMRDFVRLPRELYRGMPGFVPPLDLERHELFDRKKGPFFNHGDARFWIARRGGQAVGRISAQIDPAAPPGLASFGALDAADDREAVARLLAEAQAWVAAQGATTIRGPFTLSVNGEAGLLVEGRSEAPMILMPWHPDYLEGAVRAAGFAPVKDLLAFTLSVPDYVNSARHRPPKLGEDVRVRGLDLKRLPDEVEAFRALFNESWRDNWGFVPMQPGEVQRMGKAMRPFLYPDSAVVIEAGGELACFCLVLPNIFEFSAGIDGSLLPFGWATFAWRLLRQDFRSARMVLMGLKPRYRQSAAGAMMLIAMLDELVRRASRRDLETLEMSWILEDNRAVIGLIERAGGVARKRYRLYEKSVTPPAKAV
ncbi:MAG TPA: hypothetical protein VHL98_23495 [Microvirga sp.]|jgi:hypothetical protein|nr:hypothetical protein [Microvirga sp.]